LADRGRAVVLISSDLPEVLGHSDRIGVFRGGRLVALYDAASATPEKMAAAALPAGADAEGEKEKPTASAALRRVGRGRAWESWLREAGLLALALLFALGLAWRTDTFWQPGTLRDVGENAALLVLCGLGAALVILASGIDISFGAMMALGGATAGYLMREEIGWPPAWAAGLALLITATAGAFNAALSLLGHVHPIVVTLGTMSLYRGLTLLLIGGRAIHEVPARFRAPMQA